MKVFCIYCFGSNCRESFRKVNESLQTANDELLCFTAEIIKGFLGQNKAPLSRLLESSDDRLFLSASSSSSVWAAHPLRGNGGVLQRFFKNRFNHFSALLCVDMCVDTKRTEIQTRINFKHIHVGHARLCKLGDLNHEAHAPYQQTIVVCNRSQSLGRSALSSEQQDAEAAGRGKVSLSLLSNYSGKPPKGDVI